MQIPDWVQYGGPAWMREAGAIVTLPTRVYPVVDMVADNYGQGIIVSTGTLDAVISMSDYESWAEWFSHEEHQEAGIDFENSCPICIDDHFDWVLEVRMDDAADLQYERMKGN